MSLLHLDFPSGQTGLYGTNTSYMLNGRYAEVTAMQLIEDPDPSVTGNVLASVSGVSDSLYRYVLPAEDDTVGLAARFYLASLPGDNNHRPLLFEWRNSDNEILCQLRLNTTGTLTVLNGSGTELSTSSPVIVTGAWQHVECKVFLNATTGTFECRVEGVAVINLSGVNTVGSPTPITCAQASSRSPSASGSVHQIYIKDLAVWNNNGSLNNNFLGSIAVYEIIPNGDVANTWGLSTGSTGYTLVDEAPPNDDTDYIYATNPPPAADKMSLTDLPVDVTSVKGLIAVVRSKKTDGGDGNLQVGMISGASTGLGSDRPITTAYTYWQDVFEVDPATGVAWTRVGVNAANIQLNRTV